MRKRWALMAACCALSGVAWADAAIRFDTVDAKAKAPPSLLSAVREATKDLEIPAVVTKDAAAAPAVKPAAGAPAAGAVKKQAALPAGTKADPAFWGADGQWCRDGGTYVGGPCDNTGHWPGGNRDPWAQDPSRDGWGYGRSPYSNPWGYPYGTPNYGYPSYRGPVRPYPGLGW